MSAFLTNAFLFHPAAIRLGWALVHFLWQGLLLAGLLEGALLFVPRANAALRYALCGGALALMPVCLVATSLCLLPETKGTTVSSVTQPAVSLSEERTGGGALPPAPLNSGPDLDRSLPPDFNRFMPPVVFSWLSGVALLAIRKAGGFLIVRRLRRRGLSAPSSPLLESFRRLCGKIGLPPDRVRLRISTLATVPMAMGWLKPVVLFPASLITGLAPAEVDLLLAHELAHIRRNDYLANLVQTVVETLFFYHPVTWSISRRMRQERENACDDLALAMLDSADSLAYAKTLLRLETLRSPTTSAALAATGGGLLQRVERLLGQGNPSPRSGGPSVVAAAVILVALATPLLGQLAYRTVVYPAETPHGKWDGWDDMVPLHLPPEKRPRALPESFDIVKRDGTAPRTFSGRVIVDGPTDGVEVGLVTLKGIHWNHPDQYQWEPVRPDGTFEIADARYPDAWKALAVRGPRTAWTFLRYDFNPKEGARNVVLRAAPSKQVRLTASGPDGANLTQVEYEPFNARPRYDDRGDNLSRQRYGVLDGGEADHLDAVLPVGEVALFVQHAGYAQDYQIVDTAKGDHLHFVLRKAGRMKITVLDADGKPKADARVKWINPAAPLSLVGPRPIENGVAYADWLVPGTFRVEVEGFPKREVEVREGETTEVVYREGEKP